MHNRVVSLGRDALIVLCLAPVLIAGFAPHVEAQWNPRAGDWSPAGARDLRVMTWNVADGLCSSADKSGVDNNWTALARIVAAMEPDVLLLQEAGDNTGNGTGQGVDSVADLECTLRLFMRGGHDPFRAQNDSVGAFVQAFAPKLRLPYVAVSSRTDGYNRNALLSRYPFADLNGDGVATASDMPQIQPHLWSPGGKGGIRGFQMVEIDLPDGVYAGDVLVGNSHLKAGTSAADHAARLDAARNIAYLLEHLLNGAGSGQPDPFDKIADSPSVSTVLHPASLVIAGGDWNEDEQANGTTKGPADWIVQAQSADAAGGGDGTDRDGSDMRFDDARDVFTGSGATLGPWKKDYLSWQDSVGTLRRAFVFETANLPGDGSATPRALFGADNVAGLGALASDHRPVIADLVLPSAACNDAFDLGYGMAAANGAVPIFTACKQRVGGPGTWLLRHAPPGARAVLVAGASVGSQTAFGGTLVPFPPRVFPGLEVNVDGTLELRAPQGEHSFSGMVLQWLLVDPRRNEVLAFSNALQIAP